MTVLHDWFQTPPGQYLLDWERAQFDAALADVFGYHALQLGLADIDALAANRMPHRWLALGHASEPVVPSRAALVTDFSALPLADALKDVRGNGARTLAIFSDPDCPYCLKLETEIKSLTDVTIYTFLMPIASLHPGARSKAIAVWCSRDRVAAWRALMLRDETSPAGECPHPVDRNIALGERLGISGTPTLVAGDGRILPGAASRAQIEAWLARATASAEGPATNASAAR